MIYFRSSQSVPPMHDENLGRDAAEEQYIRCRRVSSSDNDHSLSFEEHSVAGRTVAYTAADKLFLHSDSKLPGLSTCSDDHGAPVKDVIRGFYNLRVGLKVCRQNRGKHCAGTGTLSFIFHLFPQR